MEVSTGVWYLLLSMLGLNSLLSIFPLGPGQHPTSTIPVKPVPAAVNHSCCTCELKLQSQIGIINHEVDYSKIAAAFPRLDQEYKTETLTRLGSDLNFDLSMCPQNTEMRSVSLSSFTPTHFDCPTLFIVGARKAGTSSLYHYVSKHPDFEGTKLDRGPKVGETFYFSSEQYNTAGSWESFLESFPSDGVMTGESSVGNLVSCKAPQRIFRSCGKQAKIVMLFRNPVDRFVSNFLMRARLGSARTSNTTAISTVLKLQMDRMFKKILKKQVDITQLPSQWSKLMCSFEPAINMVYEGLYYVHLMAWLCNFPAENILIVNSEEFYSKPSVILDQVFQFLGLKRLNSETYHWITSHVYNRGQYNVSGFQTLSVPDKKMLATVYQPLNEALFSMLGWKDVNWH